MVHALSARPRLECVDGDTPSPAADPWASVLGWRRGRPRPEERTDAVRMATSPAPLLSRGVALLDELRRTTSPETPVREMAAATVRRAESHDVELTEASADPGGVTFIARDARSAGRLIGTLFVSRGHSESGWSFALQLDTDALANRVEP